MDHLNLHDALSPRADTVTTVASTLNIPSKEAARQLSAATASRFVIWADEDNSSRRGPAIPAPADHGTD